MSVAISLYCREEWTFGRDRKAGEENKSCPWVQVFDYSAPVLVVCKGATPPWRLLRLVQSRMIGWSGSQKKATTMTTSRLTRKRKILNIATWTWLNIRTMFSYNTHQSVKIHLPAPKPTWANRNKFTRLWMIFITRSQFFNFRWS